MRRFLSLILAVAGIVFVVCTAAVRAQSVAPAQTPAPAQVPPPQGIVPEVPTVEDLKSPQYAYLRSALISLPLAMGLGAALALRPKRRGTPPRSAAVIQTQIILAVIGALVMVVVGASLARAFGVVGVAGLVRYRAKVADPKDAGVMLATLAVGLASGVGLYLLAMFATAFFFAALWILESFEPDARKTLVLAVKSKQAAKLGPQIEQLLRRYRTKFVLRSSAPDEVSYETKVLLTQNTDVLSKAIADMDRESTVEWTEKKDKT